MWIDEDEGFKTLVTSSIDSADKRIGREVSPRLGSLPCALLTVLAI